MVEGQAESAAFFASICASQAYFSVRDSLFGDANDSKGLSAVQRRQNSYRHTLLKALFISTNSTKAARSARSMALEDSRYRWISLVA